MSHAPNNPDRHWDAGLRDEDVVALIVCQGDQGRVAAQGPASFLTVSALRDAASKGRVSQMKAASEGSEQHLTWPSIVSSRPGRVTAVTRDGITVEWYGDGKLARRHTYTLKGRRPYMEQGDAFPAETKLLAGSPAVVSDLRAYLARRYNPLTGLVSGAVDDRYAAAKAIPARADVHSAARPLLEKQIARDTDSRLALEVANAAAALGLQRGVEFLRQSLWEQADPAMRMEAALIATELGRSGRSGLAARDILAAAAAERDRFHGDEVRQAAVWGLGRDGMRAYDLLLPYLDDPEEDVVLHAIAAFGQDTPEVVIDRLIDVVLTGRPTGAFAAAEALRSIGSVSVVRRLAAAAATGGPRRPWVLAALGKLPEALVRIVLGGDSLLAELEPLLLATAPENWLAREEAAASLSFLAKQIS